MTLWDLPGAKHFIESECETPLRNGASVIARFPTEVPLGLEDAVTVPLENFLSVCKVQATSDPVGHLCAQHTAGGPTHMPSIQDLCRDRRFAGRLFWVDGLNATNWTAWRTFLVQYAQVSRSVPLTRRTLFFAPLTGSSLHDLPPSDVALATIEWDGVPDELDLMLFANERMRQRVDNPDLRTLLSTVVARVASWDFDCALRMLTGDRRTILDPIKTLRELGHDKGWTRDTPVSWEIGTASKAGVTHPARAALDDPPRDIKRRMWSAQASVLLPWIETRRHEILTVHGDYVRRQMRRSGIAYEDPHDLELKELAPLFASNSSLQGRLKKLQAYRNNLAHLQPLTPDNVMWMLESSGFC